MNSNPEPFVRREIITPQRAEEYLRRQLINRAVKQNVVDRYASDMEAGEWRLTDQAIGFCRNGTLLNGQHRLRAVIQSGATIETWVAYNLEEKARDKMDDGANRTYADVLQMQGRDVTVRQVAIVRALVAISASLRKGSDNTQKSHTTRYVKQTRTEVCDYVDQLKDGLDFIKPWLQCRGKGVTSAPVFAAVLSGYYYWQSDRIALAWFMDSLTGKDTKREWDGVRVVEKLVNELSRKGASRWDARTLAYRRTQYAMWAVDNGERPDKITAHKEYYPFPFVNEQG